VLKPLSPQITAWQDTDPPAIAQQKPQNEEESGFQIFGWKFPEIGLKPILQWFQSWSA
jgi:hypothetical protein